MSKAKFITEITSVDTETGDEVKLSVYKHEGGGMFAIDSSYLDQCFDDEENPKIPDPFGNKRSSLLELIAED